MSNDTKRILLFGGSGMLGKRLYGRLIAAGHQVAAPSHSEFPIDYITEIVGQLARTLAWRPILIINCAGAIPEREPVAECMIRANAVGPHIIARDAARFGGIPVIHISTDCVFSGAPDLRHPGRRYGAFNIPNAHDLYGRSKALGEVQVPHVTNVRTSFIGPEHGLWAWLASQPDGATVDGWQGAYWTGSTVDAVADAIARMAAMDTPPGGTVHLATAGKISKHEVLCRLKEWLGLNVTIRPVYEPRIDRALLPTEGWELPELTDALAAMTLTETADAGAQVSS